MAKIVFYCRVKKELLDTVEFYRQDIDALRKLGHEIIICTKYREIPFDFDMIYIWWWTYAAWPVFFAKLLGRPSIVTGTFNFRFPANFDGKDYFRRSIFQRLLIRFAVKTSSLNIFVSKQECDACEAYFNLYNAKYCYHTLNDEYMQGPSLEREMSIFNIAWSEKQNLIRKGIPELLNAIKILKDEGLTNIKLYMAGHRGDGYSSLEKKIIELGLNDNIYLLGEIPKNEKIRYFRQCEIYVQPSHYEGFGLAMAEAMGGGACVITSNVGAVVEVVGDAGIYVTPGSVNELARALKEIIDDNALRKYYQIRGYNRVKKMFSHNNKVNFMRNVIDNLL